MITLNIYGARSISLIFCAHRITESEYREMEISVDIPIYTPKTFKGSMGPGCPYSTIREGKFVIIINIYGARAIYLLFGAHQISESKY